METQLLHIATELAKPMRLSDYGIGIFEACRSKAALKKLLKKGLITVDGAPGTTATWINGGEEIVLSLPEAPKPKKELVFPLKVLFEDDHLAVIHKPAGILVSGNGFMTVANALPQNLRKSKQSDATAPWPIHRLDYATTGVLLLGKTHSAIRELSRQFQQARVRKTYYAITIGNMEMKGSISYPIDDKPAQTDFEVLNTVPSERFGSLNLLKLKPHTGRRHQIRKHLAHIGNPILGDKDYGKEGLILKGKGLYLHALQLTFEHPITGRAMTVESELPKKFGKIFPDQKNL